MRKLIGVAAAALALAVTAGTANAADKVKACFVYTGAHNDGGYSQGHETGRLEMQKALGDQVESSYVENVPDGGPDAERAFERLARDNCNIIFGTSFGFMDPIQAVAAKFPNVKFEHATGFKLAPNVTTYNARFYQGRYIIGQIAAKQSKAGVAGYIVSFPIPEVIMGINSFMLGAQSINPNFKVKIIWLNTWYDTGKEADAAKTLFDQGADIIVQHTDSPAPLQIAEQRKLHGFGQASDMISFAPTAQYTAIADNWGPYYIERVKAVIDGTWKSQASWEGLKEGMLKMAPYTNLPDDVAAAAKDVQAKITDGTLNPFAGPIYKQDGTLAVDKGAALDDGTLLGMNWYVKGIDDKIPQ